MILYQYSVVIHINYYILAGFMDINTTLQSGSIDIQFICDKNDGIYNEKIRMSRNQFTVELPNVNSLDDIHPDHLALAIILVANPFVGSELNLPFAVSEEFYAATKTITKYKVTAPNFESSTYEAHEQSVPGLAFSGGADSTAALLLMPKDTVAVFLDRPFKAKTSLYNKTAAYATLDHARALGYDAKKINCNLEYIRSPLGFPSDLAPAVPLILLASELNIDSIAFGTVLESAFRVGHEDARNYSQSGHYRVWGGLFKAAGIPLFLPVAGISEVGTSTIVQASSFRDYTRSCIRGVWPDSCENCWKCFRKNLVEHRILDKSFSDVKLRRWLQVKEVKSKLKAWPISHENVLSWSLQGKNSSGELVGKLLSRLEGSIREMDFLENWYSMSIELIPDKYKSDTAERIGEYLGTMLESDAGQVTSHSMSEWLKSQEAIIARDSFATKLMN